MTDRYIRPSAKAVIYFPEGNYILKNRSIQRPPEYVYQWATSYSKEPGRNKTTLEMTVASNSPEPGHPNVERSGNDGVQVQYGIRRPM